MMMAEPTHHGHGHDEDREETLVEFIAHHHVIIFFLCMFLGMMIFGLVLAGMIDDKGLTVPAKYTAVPINALYVFLAFAFAAVFKIFLPRLMGLYVILVVAAGFLLNYQPWYLHSHERAGNHAPIDFLSLWYIGVAVAGTFLMFGKTLLPTPTNDADEE